MKPSFALNFTDDSIQLLHRAGKGWTLVGETPFAAPDLDDALEYLRKTALGLEPGGFVTKLVIPNSQIRYLEIEAPGPDDDARRAQIAAVLEATTPLKADEIAFDWSGKGKTVKVAALDKATLSEAEGFAAAHRFNPVGFVAIPEDGAFSGEPWFGEASGAAALLKGEPVDRERSAIRILSRDLPIAVAAPAGAVAGGAAEPTPAPLPDPASPDVTPPEIAPPEATPPETPPPETPPPAPFPEVPAPADPAPDLAPEGEPPSAPPEAAAAAPLPEDAAEAPFTHVPENPAFPEDEPELASAPAVVPQGLVPAARAVADPLTDPVAEDDLPPPPSQAAMMAFASRRGAEPGAPALGAANRPDPAALARAARGKPVEDLPPMPRPPQAAARPPAPTGLRAGVSKGLGALVTAPSLPGSRKAKVKTTPPQPSPGARVQAAAATPSEAAKSLTRPGGTFGSRPAAQTKSRSVLFLSLVAILLLCLALVAAWSSFYLGARNDTAAPTVVAEGDVPAVEDEMLADGEDPQETGAVSDEAVAALDAAPAEDAAPAADLVEEPTAEALPTETEAETAAAPVDPDVPAPGVTSDNPETQSLPQQQDEIFLATADAPPPALDALSLPAPDAAADALPTPQMPPPPFGTVYAFDANGLLIPTPEGIVSPEGVMLIAGKPPIEPPSRSDAAAEAALAAAAAAPTAPLDTSGAGLVEALPVGAAPAATDATASTAATAEPAAQPDPELADRRPRVRPEGLAPAANDDAALATDPAVTVVSLRPRERPQIVLAASERARSETEAASLAAAPALDTGADSAAAEAALAAAAAAEAANPSVVAISRRPAARPGDFSVAVEAAVAAAIRAPEPKPEPEQEPEPAPEKAAKKAPAPDLKPEEQDEADEPEVAAGPAPKIPTKASVAKQATFKNAINLSKINLIGVYGTQSKRYALIRQANGKYKKVRVGDRIDGGKVEAITQTEVRYQKGGRLISLKMPKG